MPAFNMELYRHTAARWAVINPILLEGEIGVETDTGRLKVGDGSSKYSALPFWGAVDPGNVAITGGVIGGADVREFNTGMAAVYRAAGALPFVDAIDTPTIVELGAGAPTTSTLTTPASNNPISAGAVNAAAPFLYRECLPSVGGGSPVNTCVFAGPDLNTTLDHYEFGLRVEFILPVGCTKFTTRLMASGYRVRVNGLPLPTFCSVTGYNAGNVWGHGFTFATATYKRRITLEFAPGGGFGGVSTETGFSLAKPTDFDTRKKTLIVGDSFIEGTGALSTIVGMLQYAGIYGDRIIYRNGCGSTGFNNAGIRYKYSDRITQCLAAAAFDEVIFVASTNDGTNSTLTEMALCVAAVRAAQPTAKIGIAAPFTDASTPTAAILSQRGYAIAGAAANGIPVVWDPIGDGWLPTAMWNLMDSSPDGLHPTQLMHSYYGMRIGRAIRALWG